MKLVKTKAIANQNCCSTGSRLGMALMSKISGDAQGKHIGDKTE